ncbi:hypothetical protein EJ04DRAFT_486620 [Polyplosphaeria fusca]|uniref:Large ribosomal subunit protein mL49 n=1 Tax=Polyplosphaeria fusca TaxID=682080 RepID=A0A9P4R7C9_9PLEO|nr:hypothetical protein EJ04DRAFT_486620 [Polyplosphaeria fusca]
MPPLNPLALFLRPLRAPGVAPSRQLLRFSTTTRWRIDQTTTPNSSAKTIPPEPTPEPPSTPKEAANAADQAATEAATDADSAQAPVPKPTLPSKRPKSSKLDKSKLAQDNKPRKAAPDASSTNPPSPSPKLLKNNKHTPPPSPSLNLPPPAYHVARSGTNNYPVYTDYKRGGNLHLTTIRKITGDLTSLRDELRVFLNKKNDEVKVNTLTQHVVVKGHHVPEVTQFLRARGM